MRAILSVWIEVIRCDRWTRWGLDVLATGSAVWAVAVLSGQAIGLGAGFTVTIAIVAAGVVSWITLMFYPVVGRAAERRRARRGTVGDVWAPPGTSAVAELLGLLRLARTGLVEAAAEPRRAEPRRAAPSRGNRRAAARHGRVWLVARQPAARPVDQNR